jgi:glyoxylase-like metal-dependent hydrolase (beta-lactamase superfamily II)
VVTGDVLFAGAIGRTDLQGGDDAAMRRTLSTKILPLDDDAIILPGHGPGTVMGHERRHNPYLRGLDVT